MSPPPWLPPEPPPSRLETERLLLRYFRPEDAPGLLEAMNVDRPSLSQWMPWPAVENRTIAECVYTIERFRRTRESREAVPNEYSIGLFERETGTVLGGTGYARIDRFIGQAEIGYWIRADRRREGLCTEAVRALVSWGFQSQPRGWGFRRITIICAEPNTASRGVPEKLGIPLESRLRRDRWIDGFGWVDTLGFGVCADDWDQAR